jgi:hypothetical protein
MATRASARIAALSPPPNMSSERLPQRPSVSTTEWTQAQLDQYNVRINNVNGLPALENRSDLELVLVEDGRHRDDGRLVLVHNGLTSVASGGRQDGIVTIFLDSLQTIKSILEDVDVDGDSGEYRARHGLAGYTQQLLYDFVRALYLANTNKPGGGDLPGRVWYLFLQLLMIVLLVKRALTLQGSSMSFAMMAV